MKQKIIYNCPSCKGEVYISHTPIAWFKGNECLMCIAKRVFPKIFEIAPEKFQEYIYFFFESLMEYSIFSPVEVATYLAQIVHETGELRYMTELNPTNYEGNKSLGNIKKGDGAKFIGRGAFQITGRRNYNYVSNKLGVNFIENPELLAESQYAFRSAGAFWKLKKISENVGTDYESFKQVTKKINDGYNGLEERWNYFQELLKFIKKN